MKTRLKWTPFLISLLILTGLTACGLSSVLRQGTPTPAPVRDVQVTADQAAQAMQQDEFFSTFRGQRLIVQGKVRSVIHTNSSTQIELDTNLPIKVLCDLGSQPTQAQPGDAITVQAQAADAERAPSAVVLKKCAVR
jgi:hypothetical protein